MKQPYFVEQQQSSRGGELTGLKTASAYELGKDLFGKYESADDTGSTARRAHRATRLNAKGRSLNNLLN